MALKLYQLNDRENMLKFKVLTFLGTMTEMSQGTIEPVTQLHDRIFRALGDRHCYEKVFVTRNYGYLLAKHDQTRLEGKDLI